LDHQLTARLFYSFLPQLLPDILTLSSLLHRWRTLLFRIRWLEVVSGTVPSLGAGSLFFSTSFPQAPPCNSLSMFFRQSPCPVPLKIYPRPLHTALAPPILVPIVPSLCVLPFFPPFLSFSSSRIGCLFPCRPDAIGSVSLLIHSWRMVSICIHNYQDESPLGDPPSASLLPPAAPTTTISIFPPHHPLVFP